MAHKNEAFEESTDFDVEGIKSEMTNRGYKLKFEGAAKRLAKDFKGALDDLNNANIFEPNNAFILKERGAVKIGLRDYNGALIDLDKANALEPMCAITLKNRGEVKRILKDFHGALKDLDCAYQLKGDEPSILYVRGVVKREMLNYSGSLEDLNIAYELDPQNAFICRQRGMVKRSLKNFKDALEDLDKANDLGPKSHLTLTQRGVVKRELGDLDGALQDLDVANALYPKSAFILKQRGYVKKALTKFEEALIDFNKADEILSDDAYTLRHRGITKRQLQDFEGALEDLNKANEFDPNNDVILSERGVTKKGLQDFEGALEDLELANYINPNHPFILKQRGAVQRELKNFEGALQDLNMANNLEPNDPFTLIERGMTRRELKDLKGALDDYNMAKDVVDPLDPFILCQRGSVKRILEDFYGALEDLNAADKLQPNNAQTLKERSHVKRALKDMQGAIEDSNKAYQLGGYHRMAFEGGLHRFPTRSSIDAKQALSSMKEQKKPTLITPVSSHTLWIDHRKLIRQKHLGSGSWGHVDQCKWRNQMVAVKYLRKNPTMVNLFEREVAILASLHHPRIVSLIGCAYDKEQNQGVLVMELMNNNLRNVIDCHESREGRLFDLHVAVDIMTQIAEAMEYLHSQEVLHRDLKSNNILVNPLSNGLYDVKVADFGISKCKQVASQFYTPCVGATQWRAPEILSDASSGYSWPVDVWSFSMTCYEILSGNMPFERITHTHIHREILGGGRPKLDPNICPGVLSSLLKACWSFNPLDRPTFPHICKILKLYRNLILDDPGDVIKTVTRS